MASASHESALVFDLGGVIVAHDNELLFQRLASRCTAEDALQRVRTDSHGTSTGERSVADVHRDLVNELGYSADWQTFKTDWSCHFALDSSMLAFVQTLAKRHRVMIFSNTNAEHWEFLVAETNGALAEIEPYLSHEIGDEKPNVSAFEKVAKAAGIVPAKSIFIDDVAANVEGARAAGFSAHQFVNQPTLERFLRAHGITWND